MSSRALLFTAAVLSLASAALAVTVGIATLRGEPGNEGLNGTVTFTLLDNGSVRVQAYITNVGNPDQGHSLIIYANGKASNGNMAHFTLNGESHGCPASATHHTGDLGNFASTNGVISMSADFDFLALTGDNSIIGRGVALHQEADDCNNAPATIIAQGVIGVANVASNAAVNTLASVTMASVKLFGTSKCVAAALAAGMAADACGGEIYLQSTPNGISVSASLRGPFAVGKRYGFHVHTWGDLAEFANVSLPSGGTRVGPHLNLNTTMKHGFPNTIVRHTGDFGNARAGSVAGVAYYNYTLPVAASVPIAQLLGRAFSVHSKEDGGFTCDPSTGDAGDRWLIGVIGVALTDLAPQIPMNSFAPDDAWTGRVCGSATAAPTATLAPIFFNSGPHETSMGYNNRLVAGVTIGVIAAVTIMGAVGYYVWSSKKAKRGSDATKLMPMA